MADRDDSPPADERPARRSRPAWRRWLVPLAVMAALTAVLAWVRGEPLRELTAEQLEAARRRWRQAGPDDYALAVQLEGRQSGLFKVRVAAGQVASATLDGQTLPQRSGAAWTVDGMLQTMSADMEMRQRAERGGSGARALRLLAVIDEQTGLPRRYLRIEMLRQGANPEAGWRVVSFVPGDAAAKPRGSQASSQPWYDATRIPSGATQDSILRPRAAGDRRLAGAVWSDARRNPRPVVRPAPLPDSRRDFIPAAAP